MLECDSGLAFVLNQSENPKPAVGMVGFDFLFTWREADTVEGPLLDFFVGWDVVPTFEFLISVHWDPVASEDALLVAIDVAGARDGTFGSVLEITVRLELFLPLFF